MSSLVKLFGGGGGGKSKSVVLSAPVQAEPLPAPMGLGKEKPSPSKLIKKRRKTLATSTQPLLEEPDLKDLKVPQLGV